jgi:UDP-N-acetylmuramate--alanine ligase
MNSAMNNSSSTFSERTKGTASPIRKPTLAVVTTIDAEHLDYYRDLAAIREAFLSFVSKVPFYGVAVLCADQPEIQAILPRVEKRVITYGLGAPADLVAASVRLNELTARFEVLQRGDSLGELRLQVPGLHNVANALAATAVGLDLEVPFAVVQQASPASRASPALPGEGAGGGHLVVDTTVTTPRRFAQPGRAGFAPAGGRVPAAPFRGRSTCTTVLAAFDDAVSS